MRREDDDGGFFYVEPEWPEEPSERRVDAEASNRAWNVLLLFVALATILTGVAMIFGRTSGFQTIDGPSYGKHETHPLLLNLTDEFGLGLPDPPRITRE